MPRFLNHRINSVEGLLYFLKYLQFVATANKFGSLPNFIFNFAAVCRILLSIALSRASRVPAEVASSLYSATRGTRASRPRKFSDVAGLCESRAPPVTV